MKLTSARENGRFWRAVVSRDARFDGRFVFAVRTTGIFCRPSCASRRPRRDHVVFFADPPAAERAGFRACRRCRPGQGQSPNPQRELVERVCRLIEANLEEPLTLARLGREVGASPHHLQRMFKRLVGVSPRQYADAQRLQRFKSRVRHSGVTSALYEAGYGSSSRLYERAHSRLGMTPATYRRGGENTMIDYTLTASPLGRLLVARTQRGLCAVSLADSDSSLVRGLRKEFPRAQLRRDHNGMSNSVRAIVRYLEGRQPQLDLPLDVRGTAFQLRVWEELRRIPYGETRTYGEVARAVGKPGAARAVGTACGRNPVPLVIPCHRVVRGGGALGGYGLGIERKRKLLAQERNLAGKARNARKVA